MSLVKGKLDEGDVIKSGYAISLIILSPQWSMPESLDKPTQVRSEGRRRTSPDVGECDFFRGDGEFFFESPLVWAFVESSAVEESDVWVPLRARVRTAPSVEKAPKS